MWRVDPERDRSRIRRTVLSRNDRRQCWHCDAALAAASRGSKLNLRNRNRQVRASSSTASYSQSVKPHGRRRCSMSADAQIEQRRETPQRDRAEHGSPAQRVAGRWALKGTKPQERRPIKRRRSACDSATIAQKRSRDAEGEIGPMVPGSSWAVDGQATCRLVRQARTRRWRGRRGAGCS